MEKKQKIFIRHKRKRGRIASFSSILSRLDGFYKLIQYVESDGFKERLEAQDGFDNSKEFRDLKFILGFSALYKNNHSFLIAMHKLRFSNEPDPINHKNWTSDED